MGIITLILNIVLIVFLLVGILFGLKRGVKKAGLRLVIFLISILVAGLITPIISTAIMNIEMVVESEGTSQIMSLNNFLVEMISSAPEMQELLTDVPALESLIQQFPLLFGNLIVFLLLIYIVGFVGYIVYTIVSHILQKSRVRSNPEYTLKNNQPVLIESNVKQKKHRILGAVIGGVQGLLLLFFTLVPISGVVRTFNDIIETPVSAETQDGTVDKLPETTADLLREYLPKEVFDVIDAYNASIYAKVDNALPLTELCFNSISTVKVNGEKIVFAEEIKTIAEIYDNVAFLMNIDFSGSLEDLDFEKIENAVNLVFNVKTLKSVAPQLVPYILNELKIDDPEVDYSATLNVFIDEMITYFEQEPDVMETLKSDVLAVVRIAKVCVQSGLVTELSQETINIDEVLSIIKNEEYATPKDIINNFFSSKTIKQLLAEGGNFALTELENVLKSLMPEGVDKETVSIGRIDSSKVNWTDMSNSVADMFISAFEIYEQIKDVDTEQEDFNKVISSINDYNKVIINAGKVIDGIKELPLFAATSDNTNIYNNIMAQLNKTEYGRYFDFTKSSTNGFWESNMTAVAGIVEFEQHIYECFEGFDGTQTEIQPYLDKIDFDKYETAIEDLMDCSLFTIIHEDAVDNFKEDFITNNEQLDKSAFDIKLLTNILDNISKETDIVTELKEILLSGYNMARAVVEAKLVDELSKEEVDAISIIVKLQNKNDDNKTVGDVLVENLFKTTTVRTTFIDALNYGLENLEIELVESEIQTECELGRVDYSKVNWETFKTELKQFFTDLLSFETLNESIEVFDAEVPVEVGSFVNAIGKSLQDIRDFSIFQISETENIFDNIVNSVKEVEQVKTYFDLEVLLEENAIETEFAYLASAIDNLVDAEVFSYLSAETEFTEQDFVNISKNLVEKVEIEENQEKTRVALVLEPLLESKLVNNGLKLLFTELDNMLQGEVDNISNSINGEDGARVEVSNLNVDAINDKNEHAKIVALFENIFSYCSTWELADDTFTEETFAQSDLSQLGTVLDIISNLSLFDAVSESGQKGLYNNVIDWLDTFANNNLPGMLDLSVVKETGFTWNEEFTTLQPSIKAMFTIEIEVDDGEGGKKTVKLFEGLTDINNILTLNPGVKQGEETSEVHQVLEGLLGSKIFKKVGGLIVDKVNDLVEDLAGVANENKAPDFTNYDLVAEQRYEIIKIFEDFMKANKVGVFNKLNDMSTLTDEEITLLGNLLNSFKENAYRTEKEDITNEGVFKKAYDNLLNAFDGFSDIVNTFDSPLDVDWVSVIKLGIKLKTVSEFNADTLETVKDNVVDVIVAINPEADLTEVQNKIDNVVSSLESLENSDLSNLEANIDTVLENFAEVVEVVELLDNVGVVIEVVDGTYVTATDVSTKIEGLNISTELKTSLKNIFGVA